MKHSATYTVSISGPMPEGTKVDDQAFDAADPATAKNLGAAVEFVLLGLGVLEPGDRVDVTFESYVVDDSAFTGSLEADREALVRLRQELGLCAECDEPSCPDREQPFVGAADDPESL